MNLVRYYYPIGVPTIIDRAIQAAMTMVLEEIYEQDFLKCSFGFRPNLSCHHDLATVNEILYKWKLEQVLEVDIQDFFGSLSHEWLMKFLSHRIADKRVLKLIEQWLKAGVTEDGKWQESSDRGAIQGGSISPLLANIYLHYVLDLWFEKKIKSQFKSRPALVRYADDFCFFFKTAEAVETMKTFLEARLKEFGLTISDKKTHQTNLGFRTRLQSQERRHITFLWFTIYRAKNRSGTANRESVKQTLRRVQHWPIKQQAKTISAILRGHFNYYGIAGNAKRISRFWHQTQLEWRYSLNR